MLQDDRNPVRRIVRPLRWGQNGIPRGIQAYFFIVMRKRTERFERFKFALRRIVQICIGVARVREQRFRTFGRRYLAMKNGPDGRVLAKR